MQRPPYGFAAVRLPKLLGGSISDLSEERGAGCVEVAAAGLA